MSVMETGILE